MGTSVIKCDGCGADMIYAPDKSRLVCPYCSKERTIQKRFTHKRDYYKERFTSVVDETETICSCPNCGGEVVLESFVTAMKCPFCDSTNVVKKESIKGMKADGIIPFKVTRDSAYEAGKKWLKKRFYVNKKFKKEFKPDNVNGVYIPSFVFSATTESFYSAKLGEYYYVTVGSGKDRHQERRTRWFRVSGSYSRYFDNVMIEASKQLVQKDLDNILPYDMDRMEQYTPEYVAGFSSEKNDATITDSFDVAKDRIKNTLEREILAQYHYDEVGSFKVNTDYDPITFNYVMIPMWIFGFKFKEKMYRFLVNGTTGKSFGRYPKSAPKILLTVLLILGALTGFIIWFLIKAGII